MKTPASAAMPYIQQIPGAVSPFYNPYIQSGLSANKQLSQAGNQMMTDPAGMYNSVASGYQTSPYAQNQITQETRAMNNSAAAGGFVGTPYNQAQVGQMAQGITSKDENEYMNSVMGLYHMGLLDDQDLDNLGFQASGRMADVTGNTLNTEGGLAFANQSEQNQMSRNRMGNILGLGGMGLSFLMHPMKFDNPKYMNGNSGSSSGNGASSLGGAASLAAMMM
ncbi:MAG: hypothetical protein V4501_11235 [Pseudomonadota bacterium]